ncbi:MAG: fibronectin type III domain-containing protein [Planctomycetes bacterium]|nr:fibronectin type III domain-containing protein [Planctomycetota bacterium]
MRARIGIFFTIIFGWTGVKGSWMDGPAMPEARNVGGGCLDGQGRILYVAGNKGGCGPTVPSDTVFRLDPCTGSWETIAPLSLARFRCEVVTDRRNRIFAFAGVTDSGLTPSVEMLDPETEKWRFVTPMPTPIFHHEGVLGPDGRIWFFGGSYEASIVPMADIWIYDPEADPLVNPAADPGSDPWTLLEGAMPHPRYAHGVALGGAGRFYVIGGEYVKLTFSYGSVDILDPETGIWSSGPAIPTHRAAIGATAVDACGTIYVFGGWQGGGGPYTAACARLVPGAAAWEVIENLPVAVCNMSAVTARTGDIYLMGGDAGFCTVSSVRILEAPCVSPPSAPSGLTAVDTGTGGSINISWDANPTGDSVTGYRIYFGRDSRTIADYEDSVTVGANTLGYQITGLYDYVEYYFAVTAFRDDVEAAFSAEANATPTRPAGVYAKALIEVALAIEHMMRASEHGVDASCCIAPMVESARANTEYFIAYQEERVGSPSTQISAAWQAFASGVEAQDAGEYAEAVKRYRLGWIHAERAK